MLIAKNLGFHFIGVDRKKKTDAIARREKKSQKDYFEEVELHKAILKATPRLNAATFMAAYAPTVEDFMEQVTVKYWNGGVSVYPRLETDWQRGNETWVKCDTRNCLGLYVGELDGTMSVALLENGEFVKTWGSYINKQDTIDSIITLRNFAGTLIGCAGEEVENLISSKLPDTDIAELMKVPLILPDNWEDIWVVKRRTKFTAYCCNRNS